VPVGSGRRSFYRSLKEQKLAEEELEVRSAIQQIAHRQRYGYRRITAELHRRGMQINQKRVVWIMREENLLGPQPQRFKVESLRAHLCIRTKWKTSCLSLYPPVTPGGIQQIL